MNSTALWNLLTGLAGLAMLSGIGVKYRKARYVLSPIAIAWIAFWSIQSARQLGVSSTNLLLTVAIGASVVGTLVAVTIPYWLEGRHKTTDKGH
jgi:hypothetical protein